MVRRKRSLRGGPLCRGAVVVAMVAVNALVALVSVKAVVAVVALVAVKAVKAVKAVVAIKAVVAVGRVCRHRAQVLVIDLPLYLQTLLSMMSLQFIQTFYKFQTLLCRPCR